VWPVALINKTGISFHVVWIQYTE